MKLRYNDDSHRYWLDGVPCKGVTGIASIPDDKYKINKASQRKAAIGLATTPKLLEAVAANIDNRDALDGILRAAEEAGGGNEGRDRGITAHTLTERHDLGKQIVKTPLSTEIIGNWQELIAAGGLTILPEYVERMIVYPDQKIAGRLDRIVRLADGRLAILDVKGGLWAVLYPHSIAIQLALYAYAPLLAGPTRPVGHSIEATTFEPMPDVDKEWAVIAHFPPDRPPQLVDVNIASGWKAAQKLCFPTLQWRAKTGLTRPHTLLREPHLEAPADAEPGDLEEGADLGDAEVEQLRGEFNDCGNPKQVMVWIKESVEAGRSFNIAGPYCRPTQRRQAILRAAFAWAVHGDDITRSALAHLDRPLTNEPTGANLGDLDTISAQHLIELAAELDAGALTLRFADDGTPVIAPAPPHLVA